MAPSMRVALAVAAGAQIAAGARMKTQIIQSTYQTDFDLDVGSLEDHEPLCAKVIVAETCKGTFNRDSANGRVYKTDLQTILSSTTSAVDGLWGALGFDAGASATCTELCRQTVEVLHKMRTCPPKSDVGCYLVGPHGRHQIICDVDVRPTKVAQVSTFKGDLPNFHDDDKNELLRRAGNMSSLLEDEGPLKPLNKNLDYPIKVAVRRVANLFRIYPATLTTVEEAADAEEVKVVEGHKPAVEIHGMAMIETEFEAVYDAVVGCSEFCKTSSDCTTYKYSCAACAICKSGGTAPTPSPPARSCTCKAEDCKYASICGTCSPCIQGGTAPVPAPTPAPRTPTAAPRPTPAPVPAPTPVPRTPAPTPLPMPAPTTTGSPCKMTLTQVQLTSGEAGLSVSLSCTAAVQKPKLSFTGGSANYADKYFNDLTPGNFNVLTVSLSQLQCYTFAFSGTSSGASFSIEQKAPCGGVPTPVPAPAPAPTPVPSSGGEAAAWKTKIQKVNIQAIAYVQTALRKFQASDTKTAITKWYGPNAHNEETLKKQLLLTLNSVDAMLGNVEYAMGPQCKPQVYAYVYPKAYTDCAASQVGTRACTKNSAGQFIFYICDLTLRSPVGEQIETLTHEGAHHATAYRDDVSFEGGTAYGRRACEQLAKQNPSSAILNADNFCYYVQDVTDGR